jgi:hypothetical protein
MWIGSRREAFERNVERSDNVRAGTRTGSRDRPDVQRRQDASSGEAANRSEDVDVTSLDGDVERSRVEFDCIGFSGWGRVIVDGGCAAGRNRSDSCPVLSGDMRSIAEENGDEGVAVDVERELRAPT